MSRTLQQLRILWLIWRWWRIVPEWRLGQLVVNMGAPGTNSGVFRLCDAALEANLRDAIAYQRE
jgi:hypothetical protein